MDKITMMMMHGAVLQGSRQRHYWSSRRWSHHRPHQSRHLCSIWRRRSL